MRALAVCAALTLSCGTAKTSLEATRSTTCVGMAKEIRAAHREGELEKAEALQRLDCLQAVCGELSKRIEAGQ